MSRILNPSLLLAPATTAQFHQSCAGFYGAQDQRNAEGGLSFVDVRDAAHRVSRRMKDGRNGERYLLGSATGSSRDSSSSRTLTNFVPRALTFPSRLAVAGSQIIHSLYRPGTKPAGRTLSGRMAEHSGISIRQRPSVN